MGKYQPFRDLPANQYEALKADIAQKGVLLPVVVDEDGNILDGHQRRRICAELHIDCPTTVMAGLSEDEKQAVATVLNVFRRHLAGVERSQAIQRLSALGWSARRIGETVGVHHTTVIRDMDRSGGAFAPPDEMDPETGEVPDTSASGDSDANSSEGVAPGDDPAPSEGGEASPEPTPAPKANGTHVVGKDGKKYPKKKNSSPSPEAIEKRRADIKRLAEEGNTAAQIASHLGLARQTVLDHAKAIGLVIHADVLLKNTRKPEANVVMENTIQMALDLTVGLENLVDFADLDGDHLEQWVSSLDDAIRSLQTLKRNLTKELTRARQ